MTTPLFLDASELCADSRFQQFAGVTSEAAAVSFVCQAAQVPDLSELDRRAEACAAFDGLRTRFAKALIGATLE